MSAIQYVWYLSYGSNLNFDRMNVYLSGGVPAGANASIVYNGCRCKLPPKRQAMVVINRGMYFARHSSTWNGAPCFIDDANVRKSELKIRCMDLECTGSSHSGRSVGRLARSESETLLAHLSDDNNDESEHSANIICRMYLLRVDQFIDTVVQENGGMRNGARRDDCSLAAKLDAFDLQAFVDSDESAVCVLNGWYGTLLNLGEHGSYPVLSFTGPRSKAKSPPASASYLNTIARGIKSSTSLSMPEIATYLASKPGIGHSHADLLKMLDDQ
jgi:hypothetical protein